MEQNPTLLSEPERTADRKAAVLQDNEGYRRSSTTCWLSIQAVHVQKCSKVLNIHIPRTIVLVLGMWRRFDRVEQRERVGFCSDSVPPHEFDLNI